MSQSRFSLLSAGKSLQPCGATKAGNSEKEKIDQIGIGPRNTSPRSPELKSKKENKVAQGRQGVRRMKVRCVVLFKKLLFLIHVFFRCPPPPPQPRDPKPRSPDCARAPGGQELWRRGGPRVPGPGGLLRARQGAGGPRGRRRPAAPKKGGVLKDGARIHLKRGKPF